MSKYRIKQLSRKDYTIVGTFTYFEKEYETLFDSKGLAHKVEVGRALRKHEITENDCECRLVLSCENLGEEYTDFCLTYPDSIFYSGFDTGAVQYPHHLEDNLEKIVNSVLLNRIFLWYLFGYNGMFEEELNRKGCFLNENNYKFSSDLKSFIIGETKVVQIPLFTICIESLFAYWWNPILRKQLKATEKDYHQIYDIEDGVAAAAKLLEIRSKLKKKMKISYEW